jgi:hypothetical protein
MWLAISRTGTKRENALVLNSEACLFFVGITIATQVDDIQACDW